MKNTTARGQNPSVIIHQTAPGANYLNVCHHVFRSSLGPIVLGFRENVVCLAHFEVEEPETSTPFRTRYPSEVVLPPTPNHAPLILSAQRALSQMIDGEAATESVPIQLEGTPLQIEVWSYLLSIPRGETRSYQEVARGVGRSRAVRAVASACARNNLALLIPCHRVLRSDGELGGYRWGLEKKRSLLESEQRARYREVYLTKATR